MNIYRLLFLLFICFTVSCKQQISKSKQVWLYKIEGAEVLNGDVKVVSIGDSLSKGGCSIVHFDKDGNMITSFERHNIVSSHNNIVDTATLLQKTEYKFSYDPEGRKLAMIGHTLELEMIGHTPSRHNTYTSQWNFDRNGFIINCVPNIADTSFSTVKYSHDSEGNITSYNRFFFPGKKNRHITPDLFRYKYDKEHRIIEEILLLRDKDSIMVSVKSEYKFVLFDQHNNWVKEMVHWNNYIPQERDSATWVQTRKIIYY